MKVMKAVLIAAVLCLLFVFESPSLAVPASPFAFTAEQPDGIEIELVRRGDERHNWIEGSDGYSVVRNSSSGYWEYAVKDGAKLAPSGKVYRANSIAPAGLERHLAPAKPEPDMQAVAPLTRWQPKPVSGTRSILVIRTEFSDISFDLPAPFHSEQFFGTTSVKKYYADQSLGKLKIESAMGGTNVVTVTLSAPHPDRNLDSNKVGNEAAHQNEVAFVTAALNAAIAQGARFAEFDKNSDGIITPDELCVYLVVAGYEGSGSLSRPAVWAHAWGSFLGTDPLHNVEVSGKKLSAWAMNGELLADTVPMGIGIIVHELGHQFCGLPDLYDTSYYNGGMGNFSLMAGGSWGGFKGGIFSHTPVNLDAWSRQYLGWETPQTPQSGAVTIKKSGTQHGNGSGSVKLYGNKHRETEYFLAEIRDFSGWDRGLELLLSSDVSAFSGGLLIQHIDEEVGSGNLKDGNDINLFKQWKHQGVMAVEANGQHMVLPKTDKNSNSGSIYSLWWGGNPEFKGAGAVSAAAATLDFNTPYSNFYDGQKSGISILGIGAQSDAISVSSVSGGTPVPFNPNPPVPGGSDSGGCNAGWAGLLLIAVPFVIGKRK